MAIPICAGFEGNPDLYGLGIRVGVYMQWFSSWLSVTVEPSSAQETHDANSIFVFSIVIAIIAASASRSIRPVEAFIMIQICVGYFLTVLSILGLRLQLLGPGRLAKHFESVTTFKRSNSEISKSSLKSVEGTSILRWMASFYTELFAPKMLNTSVNSVSFLKQHSLSWAGVLWRGAIAGMVVCCHIWLWYYGFARLSPDDTEPPCDAVIFMFSKQRLQGSLVIFFRAVSVVYSIIVFSILLYLITVAFKIVEFSILCLWRQVVFDHLESRQPGTVNKIRENLSRSLTLLDYIQRATYVVGPWIRAIYPPSLEPEFWSKPPEQIPRLSDLLKVYAALSTGSKKAQNENEEDDISQHKPIRSIYKFIASMWHIWTLCAIVWFILCVELTIRWNNIQGVQTLLSTGQLIPFIIGLAGSCRTLQRIFLVLIKKRHPDWSSTDLILRLGYDRVIILDIVRRDDASEVSSMQRHVPDGPGRSPMQNFATGAWA